MVQTGRNEPCPCGSGKKHKKCCLQNEHVPAGREESIKKRLNQDLLRLFEELVAKDRLEDAFFEFWGDFDPSMQLTRDALSMAAINFNEWIVHDWVDEDTGQSLIDLYIEASHVLPLAERKVLDMMKSSVLSLFEVREVFQDKGLLLKDLLLNEEHDVREKAATASLKKWDIFAARILELDGQKILSGAVYPYPLNVKEDILGDYKFGFGEYHKLHPELTMRDFMKAMGGHYCNFHWYDIIENPQMPRLTNTDGHQMVISRAFYEVKNKKATLKALRAIKSLDEHEDGNGFAWHGKRNKDGQVIVLGRVYFEKERLVLESNSRERLKKGKTLLKKHISDAVHQIDTFEDIGQHRESRQGARKERPDDIPFEVEQQIYNEYMDRHYRQWLKDRIPALGGKTPRQAMRSKKGRQQVIELLKQMENMQEFNRHDGRPCYDFSWLWDELGIEPED